MKGGEKEMKHYSMVRKYGSKIAFAAPVFVAGMVSYAAADTDPLATLTGAISVATVIAAIGAVALILVGVTVAKGGAVQVLNFLKKLGRS